MDMQAVKQKQPADRKRETQNPQSRELSCKAKATLNFLLKEVREDSRFLDNEFRRGVVAPLGIGLMSLGELQKELEMKVGFGTTVPTYLADMSMRANLRNGTAVPLHDGCML